MKVKSRVFEDTKKLLELGLDPMMATEMLSDGSIGLVIPEGTLFITYEKGRDIKKSVESYEPISVGPLGDHYSGKKK